jgi:GxxExxY protein
MKHEDLTRKIIGCAMQVHKMLGNGFQEVIYQRALGIEMELSQIRFDREKEMNIYYRDIAIGTRRVDFFVEDKIMVELKALTKLEDVHLAQAMNYLEAYNMEIGLLINFGAKSLEFKRVHNNRLNHDSKDYGINRITENKLSKSSNQANQDSDNQVNPQSSKSRFRQ